MLTSVLIANRGEIACRIIRTAKRLGMRTIAVHSEADRDAMFVAMADEAHAIGPAPAAESYLRVDAIMAAAKASGADCIHPGYGFLSERAEFAEACEAAGIAFVGPPASAIRAMGLKDAAKALVERAGVPVVPGYHGAKQEPDFLRQKAYEIGYPVLIKAVAGGGGKGMRRVDRALDFEAALESAQREAQSAFGDPRVLVEKYVLSPRHVEIQVFADGQGNAVSLFERDCSLQRRHQKVIEEAPAPGIPPAMRDAMGRAAVEAAKAVGYRGAGTVEFIADGREGLRADRFFFMEMNTRLQVEHPVTEAITGLDLVELQFRVASGEALPFAQADLAIRGHAVEARLYAEDPAGGFLPSTGKLWALRLPEADGIRVDTGVREGDVVTPYYDPMIAKVIAHGATRDEALDRLSAALGSTLIAGPKSNVAFLKALCDADGFRAGAFDTGFIDRNLDALVGAGAPADAEAVAAGVLRLVERDRRRLNPATGASAWRDDPWRVADAFQLSGRRRTPVPVLVDGEPIEAELTWPDAQRPQVALPALGYAGRPDLGWDEAAGGETFGRGGWIVPAEDGVLLVRDGRQIRVAPVDPFDVDLDQIGSGGAVKAPMHGKVVAVFVKAGDTVEKGQRLAIVEAMKMEHALLAPAAGTVAEVTAEAGAQVAEGQRLIAFATDGALSALRSLLLVPAASPRALDAGLRSGADALILDVAGAPEARDAAAAFLSRLGEASRPRVYVLVHALATGLADADLDAVMPGRPDGIVLPRAVGAVDVQHLGVKLAVREAEHGLADGATRIVAVVDGARGLLALPTLPGASPRLAGIAWDPAALAADLGAESARDEAGRWSSPCGHARAMTLIAAAAAGAAAFDASYAGDPDGLARACDLARRDGFTGRITRDPAEIPTLNAAFGSDGS